MRDLHANYPSLYASIATDATGRSRYEVLLESSQRCHGAHAYSVAVFLGEVASRDVTPLGWKPIGLANGVRDFEAGRCGASCGDSRLEWISGPVRYAVYVRFEPRTSESVVLANAMMQ